mmetsp:Transcript_19797/g.28013  ORF Transcript_19797/g.28013 Transcript_19797/m.28013 type:complete len:450 (-) Transcript_19797:1158-2507(-)
MLEHEQNQQRDQPEYVQPQKPLLSLRMKMNSACSSSGCSSSSTPKVTRPQEEQTNESSFSSSQLIAEEEEDRMDRLLVMMQQELSTYKCRDYMSRNRQKIEQEQNQCNDDDDELPCLVSEGQTSKKRYVVDPLCREKMCEWSYRVVDHFHANRETVALSMTLLDKFMDECDCDKSAFKLAAMTTLHLATKMMSSSSCSQHYDLFQQHGGVSSSSISPVISMSNLAELSRGEFTFHHMIDMEQIILETLGWHINPPTYQAFVYEYMGYLQYLVEPQVWRAIYPRAMFFAELALFDYGFVTLSKSKLALACVLNAMEGLDEQYCGPLHEAKLMEQLHHSINLKLSPTKLDFLRNRLWYLYSQSTQYYDDGLLQAQQQQEEGTRSSTCYKKQQQKQNSSSRNVDSSSPTSPLEDSSTSLNSAPSQDDEKEESSKPQQHISAKAHSPVSVVVS